MGEKRQGCFNADRILPHSHWQFPFFLTPSSDYEEKQQHYTEDALHISNSNSAFQILKITIALKITPPGTKSKPAVFTAVVTAS